MTSSHNIKHVFIDELKDIYDAELQLVSAIPAFVEAAENQDLKDAFETHLGETRQQVQRLEQIFSMLNIAERGERCVAMQGLIEECNQVIKEYERSFLRDAALIAKAQRIEHYEISAYGTLKTFAKELDLDDAESLLMDSEEEEANADRLLTRIAEGGLLTTGVNRRANEE